MTVTTSAPDLNALAVLPRVRSVVPAARGAAVVRVVCVLLRLGIGPFLCLRRFIRSDVFRADPFRPRYPFGSKDRVLRWQQPHFTNGGNLAARHPRHRGIPLPPVITGPKSLEAVRDKALGIRECTSVSTDLLGRDHFKKSGARCFDCGGKHCIRLGGAARRTDRKSVV